MKRILEKIFIAIRRGYVVMAIIAFLIGCFGDTDFIWASGICLIGYSCLKCEKLECEHEAQK